MSSKDEKKTNMEEKEKIEEIEGDEESLKAIKRIIVGEQSSPFFQQPILMDKYEMAKIKVREAIESIKKYVDYYIRKTEERYGFRIEYASAIRYNEYDMPVLVVELLAVRFREEPKRK